MSPSRTRPRGTKTVTSSSPSPVLVLDFFLSHDFSLLSAPASAPVQCAIPHRVGDAGALGLAVAPAPQRFVDARFLDALPVPMSRHRNHPSSRICAAPRLLRQDAEVPSTALSVISPAARTASGQGLSTCISPVLVVQNVRHYLGTGRHQLIGDLRTGWLGRVSSGPWWDPCSRRSPAPGARSPQRYPSSASSFSLFRGIYHDRARYGSLGSRGGLDGSRMSHDPL